MVHSEGRCRVRGNALVPSQRGVSMPGSRIGFGLALLIFRVTEQRLREAAPDTP